MNEEVFQAVNEVFARGEAAALVTIIRTQGSTPQRVGAKMLVFPDGRQIGTIGGGCYENDAFLKARRTLESRTPLVVEYELADAMAEESGLICGGQMEVYIEPLEASPHLYLVGAGHVALHLGRLAAAVGFRVHVIDDREKFSNAERFPDAVEGRRRRHPDVAGAGGYPFHRLRRHPDPRPSPRSRCAPRPSRRGRSATSA